MDPLKEMKQIYMRAKKDIPISADFRCISLYEVRRAHTEIEIKVAYLIVAFKFIFLNSHFSYDILSTENQLVLLAAYKR